MNGRQLRAGSVDEFGDEDDQHVLISGSSEDLVEKAETMISELLNDNNKLLEMKESQQAMRVASKGESVSKVINVASRFVGGIVGRGGETIRALGISSGGAWIRVLDTEDKDSVTRDISLQGTPEQVAKAEDLILDFISRKENQRSTSSERYGRPRAEYDLKVSGSVEVPQEKVGLIIGSGGRTIGRIQEMYQCTVVVDSSDSGDFEKRKVSVKASTEEDLENAKKDIMRLAESGFDNAP